MPPVFLPTNAQKFYVMSLTRLAPEIWSDANQLGLTVIKRGPRHPCYVWDLHLLADATGTPDTDGFNTLDPADPNWQELWPSDYSDDAGSAAIERLSTAFAVNVFTHLSSLKHIYTAKLAFSPIYAEQDQADPYAALEQDTQVREAEKLLWYTALFPAYPLVFGTTFQNSEPYGPVFMSNMQFSASGAGHNSDVEITASFTGGKALRMQTMTPAPDVLRDATVAPAVLSNNFTSTPVPMPMPYGTQDYFPYRTAMFSDCLMGQDIWIDPIQMSQDLELTNQLEQLDPQARVVDIQLSIDQQYEYKAPQPKAPRDITHGPRWIALRSRTVKGVIRIYSVLNEPLQFQNSPNLTLFFGGPFIFPMPNVDWQYPIGKFKAGEGYVYEYQFIARVAPDAITKGFTDEAADYPVSEFAIGTLI